MDPIALVLTAAVFVAVFLIVYYYIVPHVPAPFRGLVIIVAALILIIVLLGLVGVIPGVRPVRVG